jgi:hypothetical protein
LSKTGERFGIAARDERIIRHANLIFEISEVVGAAIKAIVVRLL